MLGVLSIGLRIDKSLFIGGARVAFPVWTTRGPASDAIFRFKKNSQRVAGKFGGALVSGLVVLVCVGGVKGYLCFFFLPLRNF